MTERLAIDYAWVHPAPAAIKAAGYEGVLRYLSRDASKNLTPLEAQNLHAAGLWIGLVWETTASRAGQGTPAGVADARTAEAQADLLGYPKDAAIFYAVDYDANPADVRAYFEGVASVTTRPVGDYGGVRITEAGLTTLHWQTCAWSGGTVSGKAHLYQRQRPTRKILGATSGWDENVVLGNVPFWQPATTPAKPTPAPAPAPSTPTHVAVGRAKILDGLNELDTAVKKGRIGTVRIVAAGIRVLVNRLPRS